MPGPGWNLAGAGAGCRETPVPGGVLSPRLAPGASPAPSHIPAGFGHGQTVTPAVCPSCTGRKPTMHEATVPRPLPSPARTAVTIRCRELGVRLQSWRSTPSSSPSPKLAQGPFRCSRCPLRAVPNMHRALGTQHHVPNSADPPFPCHHVPVLPGGFLRHPDLGAAVQGGGTGAWGALGLPLPTPRPRAP